MFRNIGEMVLLLGRTLRALPLVWRHRQKVFEQLFEIGNASLFMVCMLSLFIGGVVALQTGPVLVERGLASAVGGLIGVSMAKELGPVMMAVLIAGRIGSAMAAEIGSMRVYQELDALRTMKINPEHYLVLPRIVAIADAYEAMVHGRPYQPAQEHAQAADELQRLRGQQFDPDLVPIFLDELERDTRGIPPTVALPQIAVLERAAVAEA